MNSVCYTIYMVIYTCNSIGEPYRIIINEKIYAHALENNYPCDATFKLNGSFIEITINDEILFSGDLSTIDRVFISRDFKYSLDRFIFYLDTDDIELIEYWNLKNPKNKGSNILYFGSVLLGG